MVGIIQPNTEESTVLDLTPPKLHAKLRRRPIYIDPGGTCGRLVAEATAESTSRQVQPCLNIKLESITSCPRSCVYVGPHPPDALKTPMKVIKLILDILAHVSTLHVREGDLNITLPNLHLFT